MLRAPRPMHFLVLERAILDTVRRKAPPLAARLTVLPHPLPPDLLEPPRLERPPAPPVKIGLLGLCTPQKGLNVFLDLARKLADSPARIEFHVVGRIHEQFAERTLAFMRYLSGQPSQAPLPRAEFVRGAAALHYAAFFFDGGHYAATASGVLLDCIALGIPLIGRRHPLLDALTEAAGDIGELCAPGEEEAMLRRLAESFDLQRYEKQRANMLSLRAERTPQALAAALRRLAEPDRSPAA
jgi:glycosyltransferase involved in cell wall biosynthesis